ncbi:AAA family ATPase [Streptomyces flaveolus]|uniref:AAA family ATPase n=1 Tax=Streptomyces flaveolus TaxID=67297 RepID=UPI0037019AB6
MSSAWCQSPHIRYAVRRRCGNRSSAKPRKSSRSLVRNTALLSSLTTPTERTGRKDVTGRQKLFAGLPRAPGDILAGTLGGGLLVYEAAAGLVCCWFAERRGGQLAAVETGGALRLIACAGGAVELGRLHRFRVDGEADASLTLCDGEDSRSAFAWYRDRGRIITGTYDAMCDAVFTAWARTRTGASVR